MKVDCSMPVGIHAELEGDQAEISAMLRNSRAMRRGPVSQYRTMCEAIREELLSAEKPELDKRK